MNAMMLDERPSNEGMRSTSIKKHCSRVSIDHERTNNHVGSLGRRLGRHVVHPALGWHLGLSWAPLLSRLRLPGTNVGVVSLLATVIARPWECWSLLSGRRSRHSLPRSWWSRWSRACRRHWKPLALSRLLLLLGTRWVLLLSLLVRLDLPLLLLLRVLVPRPSVAARCSRSHLPLLVLNLPAFALGVEGRVNQMVEVVEAVIHERVLQVII
jgi:hypothetical protein